MLMDVKLDLDLYVTFRLRVLLGLSNLSMLAVFLNVRHLWANFRKAKWLILNCSRTSLNALPEFQAAGLFFFSRLGFRLLFQFPSLSLTRPNQAKLFRGKMGKPCSKY